MSIREIRVFRAVCDACGRSAGDDAETPADALTEARFEGYGHIQTLVPGQPIQHLHYCWRDDCKKAVEALL